MALNPFWADPDGTSPECANCDHLAENHLFLDELEGEVDELDWSWNGRCLAKDCECLAFR